MNTQGILYIVATPIGNLADITERAVSTLQAVDRILAEDTRHTQKLLNHLGISKPMASLHAHNEAEQVQKVIDQLLGGEHIAVVSDAGTPLISDPGYPLVKQAHVAGIRVVPIPGACAATAALSAAGLPTDKFLFLGFLPVKGKARETAVSQVARSHCTIVLYEAPHRIVDLIEQLIIACGEEHSATLAKELSKVHENVIHGSLRKIANWLAEDKKRCQGEFVVMVAPSQAAIAIDDQVLHLVKVLAEALPPSQAVKLAAKITGIAKSQLYPLVVDRHPQSG